MLWGDNKFREYSHKFSSTTICVGTTTYVDIRFLWSDILKYNSYNTSYIRKNIKVNIIERRLNGDWMTLTGNWLVTEMYLQFRRHNGNLEVAEWRLSAPTQWWRFFFWFNLTKKKLLLITVLQVWRFFVGIWSFHTKLQADWTER